MSSLKLPFLVGEDIYAEGCSFTSMFNRNITLQLLKNETISQTRTLQPSDFEWNATLSMYEVVNNVTKFFLGNTLQATAGYACQIQIEVGEELRLFTSDTLHISVKGYLIFV